MENSTFISMGGPPAHRNSESLLSGHFECYRDFSPTIEPLRPGPTLVYDSCRRRFKFFGGSMRNILAAFFLLLSALCLAHLA